MTKLERAVIRAALAMSRDARVELYGLLILDLNREAEPDLDVAAQRVQLDNQNGVISDDQSTTSN